MTRADFLDRFDSGAGRLYRLCQSSRWLFLGLALACSAPAICTVPGYTITVLPSANPGAFEQLVTRISTTQSCTVDPQTVRVHQNANIIRIDVMIRHDGCVVVGATETHDIAIGSLPPGTYSVEVFNLETSLTDPIPVVVSDTYATKTGPLPLVDFTDHWWNPSESGWGMSIVQHTTDRLFAVWFVYDAQGKPTWYTPQPGGWVASPLLSIYSGPIYKTSAPYFGGPFDPHAVTITLVGSGTLTFSDYTTGTFDYTIEGVVGSKAITRLSY